MVALLTYANCQRDPKPKDKELTLWNFSTLATIGEVLPYSSWVEHAIRLLLVCLHVIFDSERLAEDHLPSYLCLRRCLSC